MQKEKNNRISEPTLPVDRRSRIKELGDQLLHEITSFEPVDGVEEEFLYEIPEALKTFANTFEHQVKRWDSERHLSASELSVTCGILRKARIAAETRRFMELTEWLGVNENWWKTRLHFRKRSYGTASLLWFVGATTGFGTNIKRWLLSIAVIIIISAVLASPNLDYGTKHQSFGNAIYWSIITISTVGYGDITPKDRPVPKIIAASEAVIGLVMFIGLGMLIGEKMRRT
ncbi:MAG: Ion channel [Acidobacteriota bacterium]|nr:Ion channel [Acidobacteriota bacterium]